MCSQIIYFPTHSSLFKALKKVLSELSSLQSNFFVVPSAGLFPVSICKFDSSYIVGNFDPVGYVYNAKENIREYFKTIFCKYQMQPAFCNMYHLRTFSCKKKQDEYKVKKKLRNKIK